MKVTISIPDYLWKRYLIYLSEKSKDKVLKKGDISKSIRQIIEEQVSKR